MPYQQREILRSAIYRHTCRVPTPIVCPSWSTHCCTLTDFANLNINLIDGSCYAVTGCWGNSKLHWQGPIVAYIVALIPGPAHSGSYGIGNVFGFLRINIY